MAHLLLDLRTTVSAYVGDLECEMVGGGTMYLPPDHEDFSNVLGINVLTSMVITQDTTFRMDLKYINSTKGQDIALVGSMRGKFLEMEGFNS